MLNTPSKLCLGISVMHCWICAVQFLWFDHSSRLTKNRNCSHSATKSMLMVDVLSFLKRWWIWLCCEATEHECFYFYLAKQAKSHSSPWTAQNHIRHEIGHKKTSQDKARWGYLASSTRRYCLSWLDISQWSFSRHHLVYIWAVGPHSWKWNYHCTQWFTLANWEHTKILHT